MAAGIKVDVPAFWENGYQIIRGVYTPERIQQLRHAAWASRKAKAAGDLLSRPLMRDVLLDGNMVEIARQILGQDQIVYAGDSSCTINSNQHGYHKDNTDRTDPNAPDWQGRYTILRFGIYLQDHTRHTGGLNLREKSHNTVSLKEGKNIYVKTKVGDVAVWSLRTSHSGNGSLLKFPWWIQPAPERKGKWPKWWREAEPDGDRMAVFAALGLDDAHHHRYVEYLKTRKYICDTWRRSHYDDDVIKLAEKVGLTVRNVPKEIENDPTVGKNEAWQPTPY